MAIIEEEETTVEEVQTTETTRRIQCDVCDDSWPEDSDMNIHEFSVNRTKTEEFDSLYDLSRAIDAYHAKVPVEKVVENGGNVDVPKAGFAETILLQAELDGTPASPHIHPVNNELSEHTPHQRRELEKLIGDDMFYLKDGFLHHFMYRLTAKWTSDETRHVCEDCYQVVF